MSESLDTGRVRKALQRVIGMADYDLAKSLDPDTSEDGSDGWPELVDLFISEYGAGQPDADEWRESWDDDNRADENQVSPFVRPQRD